MQNILVVQTAFLGDLLLSVPLLKNLRRLYPQAQLHLVCRSGLGSFFQETDLVHAYYEIQKNNKNTYQVAQKKLKNISFDIIISPHESFRTMLFVRSLKAAIKVSFQRWYQSFAYTHLVERPMQYPEALRQLFLLGTIAEDIKEKFKNLDLQDYRQMHAKKIPDWASMQMISYQGAGSRRVLMAPGSVWATKMWCKEYYAEMADWLVKKGFEVSVIGANNELQVCNWIQQKVPQVHNLAGKTNLIQLLHLCQNSRLLLCNDSGPMHMAALTDLPTISFFGPTVLSFGYRPWQNHAIVLEEALSCRPCGKHGHQMCPLGTHECMKKITPQKVKMKVEEIC